MPHPPRLILHMGVHKTGTTSLQHFLRRNRAVLSDEVHVLTPEKGSALNALANAVWHYAQDAGSTEAVIGAARQMRNEIARINTTCLLSHENLAGAMMGTGELATLYPRLPEIAALLDTHLAPSRPEYVFYTREMSSWKRSVHNQVVKSNSYAKSFAAFQGDTVSADWNTLALGIDPARATFLPLENETDPTRPGRQLLGLAGLSAAQIDDLDPIEANRNQSLNQGALEVMRLLNALAPPNHIRRRISELVVQNQPLFNPLTDALAAHRKEH